MINDVVILVGGAGTRLRSVVKDIPKPMAPINGRPFLAYLLDALQRQSVKRVVLSVGYKYDIIKNRFGNKFQGLNLVYSVESEPLGTGGAIKKALALADAEPVCVMNGDTLFDLDLSALLSFHQSKQADMTLALKNMTDFDRYGVVETDQAGRVLALKEKESRKSGQINGGVYVIQKTLFAAMPEKFSVEKDFLEVYLNACRIYGCAFDGYFIDIGIPEDYDRAQKELL
jgi:D-glycero-alpha-D-manno-heptose 1-phosphate guanylyltransferase